MPPIILIAADDPSPFEWTIYIGNQPMGTFPSEREAENIASDLEALNWTPYQDVPSRRKELQ